MALVGLEGPAPPAGRNGSKKGGCFGRSGMAAARTCETLYQGVSVRPLSSRSKVKIVLDCYPWIAHHLSGGTQLVAP